MLHADGSVRDRGHSDVSESDASRFGRGRGPMPPLRRAAAAVLPVVLAAGLGSLATQPNIPTWYAGLVKPAFTPPNWSQSPSFTVTFCPVAIRFPFTYVPLAVATYSHTKTAASCRTSFAWRRLVVL